ncbi:restriction endonuclease subunit S [Acetobacterium tundrae]|uniref:Restriction endonuclease subunit S n=1 Tax=Acetobacterium tundrae TaxID=132932 RepID=A0ABR6WHS3_9FIRM|nr:restriction endonuclease subunit S [Acetobacterium tundrae]MBC3796037.1 restriction endonuclease subunit S [Acetobacterium tundrae]
MTAKKKKELTVEEMLEEALVKEEEQPYKVPENWVWTRLGSVAKFVGGGTPSKSNSSYWNGTIPWASVKDIKGEILNSTIDTISEDGVLNSSTNICEIGDLLLITRIEPGKSIISNIKTAINQDIKIVKSSLSSKYLHYFMLTRKDEFISNASGSTVLGISIQSVTKIKFPLPLLTEQQRIVDRIESLFEKLDQAKELIQEALDSFENRKAAILHKAFTGELTKKWREVNGVGLESWEESTLGESGQWYGGGTPSKSKRVYWEKGDIPWVTPKDMKSMFINDTIDHITLEAIAESSAKLIDEPAVLFVVRSGILRRILPTAITGKSVTVNQDMKAIVPKKADLKYLYWYCVCHEKEIRNTCSKSGTTVESINSQALYKYPFFTPSLKEQQEIVRILDGLFEKEQNAKDLYNLIDQIEAMKKVILSQAFRGKLGTNVPEEENVLNLLKEYLVTV